MHIVDPDTDPANIIASIKKSGTNDGPFHDGSQYFELYRVISTRGDKKFDVILNKPLLGSFEAGDQFNLVIQAYDGVETSTTEIYGRIEEARDPSLNPFVVKSFGLSIVQHCKLLYLSIFLVFSFLL